MKVFQIISTKWSGGKGKEQVEFVVADAIESVWEYLRPDILDEGIEISTITTVCPITRIIREIPPPVSVPNESTTINP